MKVVIDEDCDHVSDVVDSLLTLDWQGAVGDAPRVFGRPFERKCGFVRSGL